MVEEQVDVGRGSGTRVVRAVYVDAVVDDVASKCVDEDVGGGRGVEWSYEQGEHVGVVVGIVYVGGPK